MKLLEEAEKELKKTEKDLSTKEHELAMARVAVERHTQHLEKVNKENLALSLECSRKRKALKAAEAKTQPKRSRGVSKGKKDKRGRRRLSTDPMALQHHVNKMMNVVSGACTLADGQIDDMRQLALLRKFFNMKICREALDDGRPHGDLMEEVFDDTEETLEKLRSKCTNNACWKAHQVILAAVVPEEGFSRFSKAKWTSLLGTTKKSLKAAQMRRQRFLEDEDHLRLDEDRAKNNKDVLQKHPDWVRAVEAWFDNESNTCVKPGKAGVMLHYDDNGNPKAHHGKGNCTSLCVEHPTKMQSAMDEVSCAQFLASIEAKEAGMLNEAANKGLDPRKVFSIRQFRRFRPRWVMPFSQRSCVCGYHEQFTCILNALHKRLLRLHAQDCDCSCAHCAEEGCRGHKATSGLDDIENSMPCEEQKRTAKCYTGSCSECGCETAMHRKCPKCKKLVEDAEDITHVQMTKGEESRNTRTGVRDQRFVREKKETISFKEFDVFVGNVLFEAHDYEGWRESTGFLEHRCTAHRQSDAMDFEIDNVPFGRLIVVGDFAMNFSHVRGEAQQEEHWTAHQTTISPLMVHRRIPNGDGTATVWCEGNHHCVFFFFFFFFFFNFF